MEAVMSAKKKRKHKNTAAHSLGAAEPARIREVVAAMEEESLACYANADWRKDGVTPLYVLRRQPDGQIDIAVFSIDVWCAGLCEAWGDRGIAIEAFASDMLRPVADGRTVTRIEPELARKLLAGGIAFARRNGFALPRNYEEWAELLGDLGGVSQADCSDFGADGVIVYIGTRKELSRRLTGATVEEFLARPDVDFVELPEEEGYGEEPAAAEVSEAALGMIQAALLSAVRKWCFAGGIKPYPKLPDAAMIMLTTVMEVPLPEDDEEPSDATLELLHRKLAGRVDADLLTDGAAIEGAFSQLMQFATQFEDPVALMKGIGLGELLEDE